MIYHFYTVRHCVGLCVGAVLVLTSSCLVQAEDWSVTEAKLFAAREQWEHTCEILDCMGEDDGPSTPGAAEQAIVDLAKAWAEGMAKWATGITPREIVPTNNSEMNSLAAYLRGRWVSVTSWGNYDALGEIEGISVDFSIMKSHDGYSQRTIHYDLDCISSGEYSRVVRGSIRFHNNKEKGECRDVEIGVRVLDNGTIKWTRFVSDFPVAWATLGPVPDGK
ncbi:hypothetical protein OEG84_18030 [Hoeflea sp. G2-23]|uniref:SnoaL-like domain-containing protein n=1 Tax=Hoeflea algicola TaxID=2983763 RepID=A0ABT3ZCQ4_9HYPH|nr:hypothetical protein [Hoeflea algicola]MCY0149552.1 hypothetical protein [Hoeflea algicola]